MEQNPLIPSEVAAVAALSGMPSVEAVRNLEGMLQQFPQLDLAMTHLIHDGLCARTIFIPAGTIMTGALGNVDTVNVLVGDITVTTDEGTQRLTGFNVIPGTAGKKRAGVSHADTWWTTVWKTEKTTLRDIEDEYTDESAMILSRRQTQGVEEDRHDFALIMAEYGISPEFMRQMVENESDLMPMPADFDALRLRPSSIEGLGLFATIDCAEGFLLAPMRLNHMRTPAGRYINHSKTPNSTAFRRDADLWCYANRTINNGEEITLDYRQVLSVNTELKELLA